ncbi:MAG: hypothetical protein QM648_11180 [Solirubrobacterales bacterium]
MSDQPNSNDQLNSAKRAVQDVIADMKSRNLLLPAIVLVVALVAAMIVLPKKSEPVDASAPAPIATPTTKASTGPKTIEITLVTPNAIGESGPLTSSRNPFEGDASYTCTVVSSGDPKVLSCQVADLKVRVTCPQDADGEPCGDGGGSSGATGGSGGGGSTSSTTTTVTTGGGGTGSTPVTIYAYQTNVQLDGKNFKGLEQGESVPSKSDPVATFDGVDEKATRASFMAAAGSTVTGATVDKETGRSFTMKVGQTVKITESDGTTVHKLKLTKISKVKV